jgi:opacity protein-like surface antigen
MRSFAGNRSALAIGAVVILFGFHQPLVADEFLAAPAILFADSGGSEASFDSITLCSYESCADAPKTDGSDQSKPICGDDCGAAVETNEPAACSDECGAKLGDHPLCCDCCSCRRPCYVSVSGGWDERETVHEIDDARTFIKFGGGVLANAAIGVRCDNFRMEFETSFMNNGVDLAGAGGLSSQAAGNVNLRAYMFNVYHDVEFKKCCWKPYVGAGIGVYQSELNGLNPEFFDQLGAPFAGQPVNATSNMPFAYQFRVGVSRPLGCRAELYSGYRYFRGEELEFASAPFASFASTFHPDGAKVHAIELGVRVNF